MRKPVLGTFSAETPDRVFDPAYAATEAPPHLPQDWEKEIERESEESRRAIEDLGLMPEDDLGPVIRPRPKQRDEGELTERERAMVDRAVVATVQAFGGQLPGVQTVQEQAESQYVEVQDDRWFRKFMEQFGDKKRARSRLYSHLRGIGCSHKTAGNRATGAKSRFEGK
jgi:hypothetical protein